MGLLRSTVVLSTLALTTAALISVGPRGKAARQVDITEYFTDPRYPDEMVNPSFMTVICISEGVFPHPYDCTWFYRCHDRLGSGFFYTTYFICAPGTEFDDDLDLCIPKSGTCDAQPPPVRCGIENQGTQRIVNGVDVNLARKYSWQVGLSETADTYRSADPDIVDYFCGGSIISDRHILTAAHCFENDTLANNVYVGIGDHNLKEYDDSIEDFKDPIRAKNIIVHEDYNKNSKHFDIAIVELSAPINLLKHADVIHPICLPQDDTNDYSGLTATITGWGSTVGYNPEDTNPPSAFPSILQEAKVTIVTNSKCPGDTIKSQICAETKGNFDNGGQDVCQGDSGGPLSVKQNGHHVQVGLVSYGDGCASEGERGVYTRVSSLLDWIKIHVGSENIYTLY